MLLLLGLDLLSLVLTWCNLDDWYHTVMLCTTTHKKLRLLIRTFIQKQIQLRLNTLLADIFGPELNSFLSLLCKRDGCITGSVFIELLLGRDVFEAGDIDVFVQAVPFNGFTSLHRFLYERSTLKESTAGDSWKQKTQNSNGRYIKHTSFHIESSRITMNTGYDYDAYNIKRVWMYPIGPYNIQVIEIQGRCHANIVNYIRSDFDFDCCTSIYHAKTKIMSLCSIDMVMKRSLRCTVDFLKKALFFSKWSQDRHEWRVDKQRGFCLFNQIPYQVCREDSFASVELHIGHYFTVYQAPPPRYNLRKRSRAVDQSPKKRTRHAKGGV